jgi:hypothetical protein
LHCFFYFATFLVGSSRIDLLRPPPAVGAREINFKITKALGLVLPEKLLARADEVIE